jgi:hypothetical protein
MLGPPIGVGGGMILERTGVGKAEGSMRSTNLLLTVTTSTGTRTKHSIHTAVVSFP